MMDFNIIKKCFVMFFLCEFSMIYANCNKNNFIIFWDYNPELSVEYLNNTSIQECIKKYPNYIKFQFSEFDDFDINSKTFILKSELDAIFREKIENQFNNSQEGKLYFSIVVDGRIILNGLNRMSLSFLLPTNYFAVDQNEYLILFSMGKKYFRISKIYNFEEIYENSCLDMMSAKTIKSKFK